jgi:hypothetical protein
MDRHQAQRAKEYRALVTVRQATAPASLTRRGNNLLKLVWSDGLVELHYYRKMDDALFDRSIWQHFIGDADKREPSRILISATVIEPRSKK